MILQIIRGRIVEEKRLLAPVTSHQRKVHEWLFAKTGVYPRIVCVTGDGRRLSFTSYKEFEASAARTARDSDGGGDRRGSDNHRKKLRAAWKQPTTRTRHQKAWDTGGRQKLSRTMRKIWREMKEEVA